MWAESLFQTLHEFHCNYRTCFLNWFQVRTMLLAVVTSSVVGLLIAQGMSEFWMNEWIVSWIESLNAFSKGTLGHTKFFTALDMHLPVPAAVEATIWDSCGCCGFPWLCGTIRPPGVDRCWFVATTRAQLQQSSVDRVPQKLQQKPPEWHRHRIS